MTSVICSVRGCHNNWMKRREFLQQQCFEHQPLRRSEPHTTCIHLLKTQRLCGSGSKR
ncbi:unnamed protein product [Oncorhynchus mykiss]|uniref:Uncharacterized protein n=1 Tax=Oncorhynchus mykiss TaxID=8022 RepID=A0A060WZK7_ONCMY|nr:unnamed protein product [Oncorhynchus mykiss]